MNPAVVSSVMVRVPFLWSTSLLTATLSWVSLLVPLSWLLWDSVATISTISGISVSATCVIEVLVVLSGAAIVSPFVWRLLGLSASLSLVCWRVRCRILQVGDIFSVAFEFLKPTFLYFPHVLGFFILLFTVTPPKLLELLANVDRRDCLYLIKHFAVLFFEFCLVAFCYHMVKFGLCLNLFQWKCLFYFFFLLLWLAGKLSL